MRVGAKAIVIASTGGMAGSAVLARNPAMNITCCAVGLTVLRQQTGIGLPRSHQLAPRNRSGLLKKCEWIF
jgi:hypothetical protein